MAYVKPYGRPCTQPGCSKPATLVVCNQQNAECNYFCASHRAAAERLAATMTETERRE